MLSSANATDTRSLALNIQNLRFAYSNDTNNILDIPEWSLQAGKSVFLHGPSGSGKTTLLNILSGTLDIDHANNNTGSVQVLGEDIVAMPRSKKDAFRANNIGVVFQRLNLIAYLSVMDHMRLASHFSEKSKFNQVESEQLLTSLALPNKIFNKKASELSVGQQQRVAIARALIHKPKLLIVDEPTSALDANATGKFIALLLKHTSQLQTSVVFVSHDMRLAPDFDSSLALDSINHANFVAEAD